MNITVRQRLSANKEKIFYSLEWGKAAFQRKATGIFTYRKCKTSVHKRHNEEALLLLETKRSELFIESMATGSTYVPRHKFNNNFLDFYREFVADNQRPGNRHLKGSLDQFMLFSKQTVIAPADITENTCVRFRHFLLDKFSGKSPADYFGAFKRVLRSATKQGYYRINPADDIRSKRNPSQRMKGFLEADEYLQLIETPMTNDQVRDAFICCCFTGLRWCDICRLTWADIQENKLSTRIIQKKTGKPVDIHLHPIVREIFKQRFDKRPVFKPGDLSSKVFSLPTANGANKALKKWSQDAGLDKPITWHSARLSFSILLQDAQVDTATVALLLGHSSSRFVNETYKRHRPKDLSGHFYKLPQLSLSAAEVNLKENE